MFGPTPLRDIFLVAGFELREMVRSRRAALFTALYLLVAAMGSYFFVWILTHVEPPRPPPRRSVFSAPARPDPVVVNSDKPEEKRLFERGSPFRMIVTGSINEQAAVDFLVAQSPITLFHFLISLSMLPLVIMITSSESIAQEHQTRGVRFIGMRTGRAEFVIGKLLGQGATIAGMTLLAGGVCIAVAWWKLGDFEFFPALGSILLFWPRLLAYCIAFLGLAGLCSMSSTSTVASRTFSLVGVVFLWIMNHFAEFYQSGVPADDPHARAWHFIQFFSPFSHQNDLWYPEFSRYGYAMGSLVLLAVIYVALGLAFYRKRDL